MTFQSWFLTILAAWFAAIALYVLVSGRLRDTTRRGDPVGYWLGAATLVVIAGLHLWMAMRSLRGDETIRPSFALFAAPYLFYCVVRWLRSGEILFGNNRIPRRGRAKPYWTILILCLIGSAFFTASIVYREIAGIRTPQGSPIRLHFCERE